MESTSLVMVFLVGPRKAGQASLFLAGRTQADCAWAICSKHPDTIYAPSALPVAWKESPFVLSNRFPGFYIQASVPSANTSMFGDGPGHMYGDCLTACTEMDNYTNWGKNHMSVLYGGPASIGNRTLRRQLISGERAMCSQIKWEHQVERDTLGGTSRPLDNEDGPCTRTEFVRRTTWEGKVPVAQIAVQPFFAVRMNLSLHGNLEEDLYVLSQAPQKVGDAIVRIMTDILPLGLDQDSAVEWANAVRTAANREIRELKARRRLAPAIPEAGIGPLPPFDGLRNTLMGRRVVEASDSYASMLHQTPLRRLSEFLSCMEGTWATLQRAATELFARTVENGAYFLPMDDQVRETLTLRVNELQDKQDEPPLPYSDKICKAIVNEVAKFNLADVPHEILIWAICAVVPESVWASKASVEAGPRKPAFLGPKMCTGNHTAAYPFEMLPGTTAEGRRYLDDAACITGHMAEIAAVSIRNHILQIRKDQRNEGPEPALPPVAGPVLPEED